MGYRPKYACQCPFYEKEFRKGICCEGISSAAGTTVNFDTEEKKYEYIKSHCLHEYPEQCPLFQVLTEKYAVAD
jgi:hypothetical protein